MRGEGAIRAGEPDTVVLTMAARPENLALARLALTGVAAVAGVSDAALADLKVAVTEACTNAIQHAYPVGSAEASVVVRYRTAAGLLEVEVEDGGCGFDPNQPPPVASQNDENQGMGLLIIRALAEEVVISSDESGSRVAFAKADGA